MKWLVCNRKFISSQRTRINYCTTIRFIRDTQQKVSYDHNWFDSNDLIHQKWLQWNLQDLIQITERKGLHKDPNEDSRERYLEQLPREGMQQKTQKKYKTNIPSDFTIQLHWQKIVIGI